MAAAAKSRRVDPKNEPVDMDEDVGQVLNRDPDKVYVWAYKVGDAIGSYESRGYDIVLTSKDGPRPIWQRKGTPEGVPVEWKDNVLMACDRETYEHHERRGQQKVDQMEQRLIAKDGPADPSRGIHRFQYGKTPVGLVNETTAAVEEAF